jgi:hypothetical protein
MDASLERRMRLAGDEYERGMVAINVGGGRGMRLISDEDGF